MVIQKGLFKRKVQLLSLSHQEPPEKDLGQNQMLKRPSENNKWSGFPFFIFYNRNETLSCFVLLMYSDSVRNTEQVTKQQRANPPMGEVSMRQIKG